jgi:shikimate dehydrogenase
MLRVRSSSRVLAVLGDPVQHSISPEMHNAAMAALGLNAVYVAFRVPTAALGVTLETCAVLGIAGNLTVPHKEDGAALVADLTDLARSLGAVNTFWSENGRLHGDNTDVAGLAQVLESLDAPGPWLVCGTGGSARAVAAVAAQTGTPLLVRSRSAARAEAFCTWARTLVPAPTIRPDDGTTVGTAINATPVGLDHLQASPVPPDRLSGTMTALDLVYRPGETGWVRACRARGMRAVDGRDLLLAQGTLAFARFFPGQRAPREQMRAAIARALRE